MRVIEEMPQAIIFLSIPVISNISAAKNDLAYPPQASVDSLEDVSRYNYSTRA